jgi:hypothetical protein
LRLIKIKLKDSNNIVGFLINFYKLRLLLFYFFFFTHLKEGGASGASFLFVTVLWVYMVTSLDLN